MPHDWRELFLVDPNRPAPADDAAEPEPERRRGFFRRLRENLSRTRAALGAEIHATLFDTLDDETWERLEEALIMADVGAVTTAKIVGTLEQEATEQHLEGGEQLTNRLIELMAGIARAGTPNIDLRHGPTVIMVCGVNGTGKTTSIGKIAWHIQRELGLHVVLGAADTFRAAAADQLETWGRRVGAQVVRSDREGADPASVAFDAVKQGIDERADTVIVDTAGRLHTKTGLMDELGKIKRVIERQATVDEVLLVLDATTGQNGLRQARVFAEAVDITGIVLTKLDGTAKGGIVVAVQRELGVPVKLVGLGEGLDDLAPFEPATFIDAILG
jgi:fused signal recognition particle receptor